MKRLVWLSACLLALLCTANAGDIYNNLNSATAGQDPVTTFGPLADSFSTGVGGFSLNQVTVLLNGDNTSLGSIAVYLLSDKSTSPGVVLATFGTLSDSSLTSSLADYTFKLATPYGLGASTRYWVEIVGSNSSANWAWSPDQNALGVAGEFFANQNGVFQNVDGPYQMELSGSPIPEPSTPMVLASGLLALVGLMRRKLLL